MRRGTRGTNGYSARTATHWPWLRALPASPRGPGSALIDLRGPPVRIHDSTAQGAAGKRSPAPAPGRLCPCGNPRPKRRLQLQLRRPVPRQGREGKGSASPTRPATRFA